MGEIDNKIAELRKQRVDLFDEIRQASFERALKILKDPKVEIPPGQLLAFVAKVGVQLKESEIDHKPKIEKQTNILAILPGLPPERAQQIVQEFEKQLGEAKKALEA